MKGWEDAYYVDFSFSGGDRPIVLSYDTSPAYTVKNGETPTAALLDTCFRQVEYAGVLEGAANPEGAEQVIDFLLSPEVQEALPTSMYVFPVDRRRGAAAGVGGVRRAAGGADRRSRRRTSPTTAASG